MYLYGNRLSLKT